MSDKYNTGVRQGALWDVAAVFFRLGCVGFGWPAVHIATVGIFLPSFLFVIFLNPLIPRLRKSELMSSFLDTVNIVSVAIILAVVVEMGRDSIQDWRTVLIAGLGFLVTFYFKKVNSAFVVLGGAALGYLLSLV